MNPLKPLADLSKAVTFPFTFLFVVGLCTIINWFTSPGHWWVQWPALGFALYLVARSTDRPFGSS